VGRGGKCFHSRGRKETEGGRGHTVSVALSVLGYRNREQKLSINASPGGGGNDQVRKRGMFINEGLNTHRRIRKERDKGK